MAKYKTQPEAVMAVFQKYPETSMRAGEVWDKIAHNNWYKSKAVQPVKGVINCLRDGAHGDNSRYLKDERGLYRSNPNYDPKKGDAKKPKKSKASDENRLIQAFGMFWDRSAWEQNKPPKLMGMQPKGKPFDFCEQRGIYILYDSHKIVYVGRATEQGIGKRLKQHITDRHKSRWNRFSWFGICKLDEEKQRLIDRPDDEKLAQDSIISDLEALLIKVAEPVQQRQRGKDMEVIEYLQAPRNGRHIS